MCKLTNMHSVSFPQRRLSDPAQPAPANSSTEAFLRVVAIGGGTGLSTLLRGLKRHTQSPWHAAATTDHSPETPAAISDLAAIVTVTDDGGSSGRLRRDMNMLPPGDLRNCMVALSEDEHLLSRLFQYRFDSGEGLEGHSFGNLFLAGLTAVTGDFALAVKTSSQILATRGHLYPATNSNVTLAALMDDGSTVLGETKITASKQRIVRLMLKPERVAALPEAVEAILGADLITLGPGSLYTSLITNLLVEGVAESLAAAHGLRVFICNLMTQSNESLHLTASQHIERIYEHSGGAIFDYALVNVAPVPEEARQRYAAEGAEPIVADIDQIERLGVRCITGDFLRAEDVMRHDYERVADALLELGLKIDSAAQRSRPLPLL
jgi:uncharacterized cofD-like protein